jgi:sulfite reductase (NADPH) hemoprotein beta-component
MVRVSIPGGGGFDAKSWRVFDDVANKYSVSPEGKPSIRLTTRQNVQYHWVAKENVIPLVREIAQTGYFTLNGCGDNFRNVMGCPLSQFSKVFDATKWAHTFADYFRLPAEAHIEVFGVDPNYIRTPDEHFEYAPALLNRKFKVGIGAVHQDAEGNWYNDNCVEMRTNEVGISPIIEGAGDDAKVERVQLYLGGGQGEKNGKPGFAGLGLPFGTFTLDNLLKGMDAIVATHQEWGDRQNRHWARLKYVVQAKGVEWYQKQVSDRGGVFEQPMDDHDYGARCLHHGWANQPSNGKLAFGAYVASGRLMDGLQNVDLKKMCV